MTRILGLTALYTALLLGVYGAAAAVWGVRTRQPALLRSARAAAYTNFILLALANLAMVYGLVTHNFSISFVAQVGSRSTPLLVTIISLWSALEGSILFWGLILSAYTAAATYFTRNRLGTLSSYATAAMLGVGVFFYVLLVGPANPFGLQTPIPVDGPGPNPLLQNHPLMAVHPPLLYLGYVGMTVPYAFAVGALLSGRLDDTWIRETRRWTVTAWMFLSLAIVAGMWWSYEVLGWGGYWAWDPVENASFMPWLTATAFLHSMMVQERRGMLKVWNLSLIMATFLLTILGTFLTRSGVLSSVHAFTNGPIGMYFLVFIGIVLLFSFALLAGRSTELHQEGRLDHPISRETVFLVNNLLFVAFTFTVLLGTLFPLVAEAVRGVKLSVGGPFFNRMTVPLCAALLFLVGVGPILPWRIAPLEQVRRKLVWPTAAMLLAALVAFSVGARQPYSLLAFGFGAFALTCNVGEFVSGTRARRRSLGEPALVALRRLIGANNRRYGGYLAHIGVIVIATGITASSTFKLEKEATLRPGQSMTVGKYTVRFLELWADDQPHRFVVGARLAVLKGERQAGTLDPRLNYYRGRTDPVPTPAVRSRVDNDLYINLIAFARDGTHATITTMVQPLVSWIWAGGFIVALGALLGVLPLKKSRRRILAQPREEALAA
ncbi:MAG: heme lyase CcmF/NrfE family subunit [Longimicrobiales bacterium]